MRPGLVRGRRATARVPPQPSTTGGPAGLARTTRRPRRPPRQDGVGKEEAVTESTLGAWDSRYVMRHVRTYPHPVDLVWEAVTTAEHLNAWMLPQWTVDLRIGGV